MSHEMGWLLVMMVGLAVWAWDGHGWWSSVSVLLEDLLAIQSDLSQNVLSFSLEIGNVFLQVDQSGFHVGDRLLQPDEVWMMLVWWLWT